MANDATMPGPAASAAVPAGLESAAPGEELARLLSEVLWDRLAPHDLVVVLRAQQRQVSHYQAGMHWTANRVVNAYEDLEGDVPLELRDAAAGAAAEIGAALRLTRRSSERVTELSVELLRRLPSVWEALLKGQIDLPRAQVLVSGTIHLEPSTAQAVVDMVLPDAGLLTTGQLAARLRKLCIQVDPDAARQRYQSAVEDRRLVLEANDTGSANLLGLDLPPHVAAAIKRWINRQARRLRRNGDTRTMDQLRADIYLDLLCRRHTKSHAAGEPIDGGIHLNMEFETLAGHNDHPGEIQGLGPVISDIARQVTERQLRAPWTWGLIDPDSKQPIDGGIIRQRPTAAQRRKVQTLNPTCVHPGCRMPAVDCDVDHGGVDQLPEFGGAKLEPRRRRGRHHHRIRHDLGWSYRRLANGDHEFTTPLGHTHTTSGHPP